MSSLEVLDLSHNNLTGRIPSSLTKLNFLSHFDVSYNNLVGVVPRGDQFSTFSCDNFAGNADIKCQYSSSELPKVLASENEQHHGTGTAVEITYIMVEVGIYFGLLIVWNALFFASALRAAYFQMVDRFFDSLYVITMVNVNRLRRKRENKVHP